MPKALPIKEFLDHPGTLFDVRSPIEFIHAHLPGARSLPLFTDAERAVVGTIYKKEGPEKALVEGLRFAGPKLAGFTEEALKCPDGAKAYCFRGGMRSQSIGWLFDLAKVPCITLKGGYKAFRRFALEMFKCPFQLKVIGGLTGSGKTAHLNALKEKGEQVLCLESLAHHKGSAFGLLGNPPQPSVEHFENKLALELHAMDPSRPIWVEDESRMIGACKIPDSFFTQLVQAPLYVLNTPFDERVERLLRDYGAFPKEALIASTKKLTKKLGGAKTEKVIEAISADDLRFACAQLLEYYDAAYAHHLSKQKRQLCTLS